MNSSSLISTPRLIRVAGLLFLLILLLAAVAGYISHLHRVELAEQGVRVQATIQHVAQLGGKNRLTYSFQVGGRTYTDERRSPLDMRVGDPIEVIYLPSNPEINDLASALEAH